MALFDADDFFNRLYRNRAKRWAGSAAFSPPTTEASQDAGTFYALFYAIAEGFAFLMTALAYVRLQTRLATLTDIQVDLAWADFYGSRKGRFPGELDAVSTARLRAQLAAPTGTHDALLAAVEAYFTANPSYNLKKVDVFDAQSDPNRAAYYGIGNAQFAVILYYPLEPMESWFLGQETLGQNTIIADPFAFTTSFTAPAGLMQAVNDTKDLTYRPIYVTAKMDPDFE